MDVVALIVAVLALVLAISALVVALMALQRKAAVAPAPVREVKSTAERPPPPSGMFAAVPEEAEDEVVLHVPEEVSPEETARLLLQESVAQVRQKQQNDLHRASRSTEGGGPTVEAVELEIDCPSCGAKIPVSSTNQGSRYVCDACGTPVRFED